MKCEEFYNRTRAILNGTMCDESICFECISCVGDDTCTIWCDDGNDQFGFPDGCSGFVQRREEDD